MGGRKEVPLPSILLIPPPLPPSHPKLTGALVDKMAGECNIDRDEAVKRLGAVLHKQAKRIRVVGKQEPKSNEASG